MTNNRIHVSRLQNVGRFKKGRLVYFLTDLCTKPVRVADSFGTAYSRPVTPAACSQYIDVSRFRKTWYEVNLMIKLADASPLWGCPGGGWHSGTPRLYHAWCTRLLDQTKAYKKPKLYAIVQKHFFTHCEKTRCSPPLKKIYCQKDLQNYTKSATLSFTHELDPPPL